VKHPLFGNGQDWLKILGELIVVLISSSLEVFAVVGMKEFFGIFFLHLVLCHWCNDL